MFKNENPVPLAGGNRADTLQADHAVDIRESLRNQARRRLQRQHRVESVNRFGSRVWFEFVDELARHHPEIADDLDRRLERFAALDHDLLAALGGDQFPASPVRLVGGSL